MKSRHKWGLDDVCSACGIRRSGYSGGRTGITRYYNAHGGALGLRAPPCAPVVVQDPKPLRPRSDDVTTPEGVKDR